MKKALLLTLVMCLTFTMMLTGCFGKSNVENSTEQAKEDSEQATKTGGNNENGSNDNSQSSDENAGIVEFKQSPILDGQNLPPVAERLPKEPKLVNEMPAEFIDYEIGRYGGTMRTIRTGVGYDAEVVNANMEWLLNTPGILGEEITPSILKGYEMSADEKKFTFFMREGLKWSDGVPVTIEDVVFTVNDVIFNEEITSSFPNWLRSGGTPDGKPVQFEVIDDYTFTMEFDEAYGGFITRLTISGWMCYHVLLKPKHYLEQFHTKYTPIEQLEPAIKEAGLEPGKWVELFTSKDMSPWDAVQPKAVGFPTLAPWMLVERSDEVSILERNPYYFKIDSAGNQLPYIDKIVSTLVQDLEMVNLKFISGEVDFAREFPSLAKMPLYKENEAKGGYTAPIFKMQVTPTDIHLNMTYDDPVWREVVRDERFRKALNLALERDEIIDSIYYGFAKPSSYTDSTYNLEEANQLLDDMGMKKGADGLRLGPDGKKFSIPFEIAPMVPDMVPLAELVVEMWGDLGLHVTMKTIDGGLWGTRNGANELQATMIWTHTPLWFAADFGQGNWAPLWWRWHASGGKEGEEPPQGVKDLYQMINKIEVSSPANAITTFNQAMQDVGDNLWYFNHLKDVSQPLIVNAKMGNIPHDGLALAVALSAETFFYKE